MCRVKSSVFVMLQELLLLNGADVDAKLSQIKTDRTDVCCFLIIRFCFIMQFCSAKHRMHLLNFHSASLCLYFLFFVLNSYKLVICIV